MKMRLNPSFDEEILLWEKGYDYVVGIDEVGRGAFAGPVVAAAVIFPKAILTVNNPALREINDSKQLFPKKRAALASFITSSCLFSTISEVPVSTVNRLGVGKAAFCAFRQVISDACRTLDPAKLFILSDGFAVPYVRFLGKTRQKSIIRGDCISKSIAAASILAKVHRDKHMVRIHEKCKEYNFSANKGYGTKEHREALTKYGLSAYHRRSFNLSKFLAS